MTRRRLIGLAVAGLLLAAPAQAEAASTCAGLKPAALKAKANKAGTAVTRSVCFLPGLSRTRSFSARV